MVILTKEEGKIFFFSEGEGVKGTEFDYRLLLKKFTNIRMHM
jgi:hypothetical protein